ncbi:uncharacterized protein BDZ99DRAFT_490130 [Mytilinidion resinicola]|uniref:Moybdenum cofactor oxidoreductase dimerisation domain-containing protein n=1 Tax=Mytilinidion resinicola TaxID=574789 RepID=A0A6A6YCC4_9PEZI|nr:uncharacterized protein BDZ99DRAFT_490130 [Mytilinidion resinicola]KAF2806163.1 hypothetical protein BDZ99DRAFT_490130 [Mytilinidion resinicola]
MTWDITRTMSRIKSTRLQSRLLSIEDRRAQLPRGEGGWKRYIEWEHYPEKKKQAAAYLSQYNFPNNSNSAPFPPPTPSSQASAGNNPTTPSARPSNTSPSISSSYVLAEKALDMLHVLQFPYNGEHPRARLVTSPITPNGDHLIRNHGGIPEIDAGALYDRHRRAAPSSPIQCGDTRRIEQIRAYPGERRRADQRAVGRRRPSGARAGRACRSSLKKAIKHCGGLKRPAAAHLELCGADADFQKGQQVQNYGVSVPVGGKVKVNEVLLAWEMNGESPAEDPCIQDMPVSSAVMTPVTMEQIVHDGTIKLRGWAYSGGGHWPERVEVSSDGGGKYYYAWRLWQIDLPVDAEGWLDFCVRTWNNALNTQPTFVRSACWDLHVTSSCHRIKIYSINHSRPATAARLKWLEEEGITILPITQPIELSLESDEDYDREMERKKGRDPIE